MAYTNNLALTNGSRILIPMQHQLKNIAVSVRLPCIPMEYYDKNYIMKIGNSIGKLLQVDLNTSNQQRGKFARLCVGVDLEKPLVSKYRIKGVLHRVEYEALHPICFGCGQYGHDQEQCSSKPSERKDTNKVIEEIRGETEGSDEGVVKGDQQMPLVQGDEHYGPWMIVQQPRRTRRPTRYGIAPMNRSKPVNWVDVSRFDILAGSRADIRDNRGGVYDEDIQLVSGEDFKEKKKAFLKGSQMRREKAKHAISIDSWESRGENQGFFNKPNSMGDFRARAEKLIENIKRGMDKGKLQKERMSPMRLI